MMRWLPVLAVVACTTSDVPSEIATTSEGAITVPFCAGPYTRPAYTRPADDGVALSTLIEGAGYGASTNSAWVDIASGNLCGGAEKELILLKNTHSDFSVMRGAARQVNDSKTATVVAFKLTRGVFTPFASSGIGNTGTRCGRG